MHDIASFIYEAASLVSQARSAALRSDGRSLGAAVTALGDLSRDAGAERLVAACDALRDTLHAPRADDGADDIDAHITAIANELEEVAGDVQMSQIS